MRAQQTAAIVAAIGLALTGIVCGLFGYVAYNNLRLSREIQVRIGFERRLTAVIDELNHRVKNILAVIQSIVTRTLRHGSDIDVARELLIGRIHAMSNVVSLLSESQWQGVKLKGLFEARAIPHAERIAVSGPDIAVSARAAQSLSLLFFELASHSDEGLSLVGKHPHIVAHWEVTGEEPDTIFHFRWEEFNTSEATRRADSDFGLILLDRVAPEALGGTSKRYFTDVSYVYELTAPMETVVDMTERDRTEQLSAPVKRAVGQHFVICEERSNEAYPASVAAKLDCFASRAMTAPLQRCLRREQKKAARPGRLFVFNTSLINPRCRRSRRGRCRRGRNRRRRRHRAARSVSTARG